MKKSYNKKDSLKNRTFSLISHPDSKEFYKISRTVSQDLKRILLKSNWLRNYLNPYLEKVKSIYKDLEQDAKKTTLLKNLQSFIEAIYGSISLKEPFRFYSKDIATNGEFNSTAIQYLLKFESNRIIYQRIQTLILNIRENLNLKGQIKNRSHNLGKNVRSLIKRDYIKRDNNRASSGNQNGVVDQTNYYLSKFMKRNFYNLRRSFLFSNQGYDETSHYTNETLSPVLRNNYYWALNRLNLPVNSFSSNTTSFSKKLWEKSKIREINKTQKTKKMLFDLFLKYNSLLNHQNSLDVYNNIFLLESDIFEPENLNSTINLRSSDKKNANLVKHFVSDKNSQFFLKEKKRNLFKDQIDEKTNVVNSDIKKDNGQPGFLLNKKKIFRERSPYATPKSSLSKGETKLINIENKLKLLGSSYSTKTTQPSFYSNLKQINLDSPAQSLWGLDYGVARKNEVPQNKALHSSLVQITKRKLSPKNFFVLRSNNFLIRKSLKVKDIVKIAPLSYKKTFFRFLKQELMLGRRSAISYNDSKEIESLISSKTNIKTLSLNFQTDNQIRMFFNLKQNLFKNLAAINKINQISNFSQMSNQNAYWWTESPTNHFRLKKDSNLFYTKKSNTCSDILERDKYFLSRVFTEQSNSEINNVSSSFNTGLSVLFHFCTLITLISLGGIRNIIKFYYILISKVSNLLNKFRFLVNFSTHYNTDIVFKEKESSFKNLIKLSLKKKQESLIPYYNSKIFSNNSKGFQLKNKIKKLKIKAFGWGIKDLNRNIKSPQIRGLRHLLKTFQITKSFFFQLAKPPSALSEDNKKTSSVNKFRELSSKRLNKNKTTKYFDTMSNYSIIDFSLIQKEFRFYNKLDKEKDLSFNLKTSNFLLVQTLVNLPFITLNFGREANPLTPKKDIKMVGGFSPFIQIKSSIQSMLWVSRFIANSFFLSKIEKTRKLNSVNIGKGLSAQIERSLQEQNNIQKESSELFKNKNIYIWTSLYSLSKKNRKLLYDSNLKLSIGLMFGYKVSFYTYLLLLKSVDVLAAPAFFIYKFFEKPGEYVVENLAYSFLLEWSADLVSTVPDSIDNSISISFSKLNRNIPFYFNLPSLNSLIFHGSLTNKIQIWFESLSNVTKNSAESHTNITNSLIGFFGLGIQNSLYRRFIRSSLLLFIQQLCEPDLDSINRQQKGILFWETWGESLKSVAESNSVNIYELSTDKEEQLKLLSNLDAFWSFNQSNSLTNSQNRPNKTNSLRFNNFSYHTNFTDIVELEKDYSNERPSFVLKNSNIKKEIGNLLSNLPFHLSFSGSPKDEISSHSLIGGLRTAFNQKKNHWSVNQFLNYQGKDTDLFMDLHPPRNFLTAGSSLKYSFELQAPIGSIVCQIFGGIFYKQISKNILVVLNQNNQKNKGLEKSLLIQAIAGETELKIISDSAHRYAMVMQGVAVGIKLLKDVFEALCAAGPCLFVMEDIHVIGERRPFLIDEASPNLTESIYNKNQSMQGFLLKEKSSASREILYKNNKNLLRNYKKPYTEFKSLSSNHFSFTFLYRSDKQNSKKQRKLEVKLSEVPLSVQVSKKNLERSSKLNGADNKKMDKQRNSFFNLPHSMNSLKALNSPFFIAIKSDLESQKEKNTLNLYSSLAFLLKTGKNKQMLINPPTSSPFNLLLMKDATKLKSNQVVNESSWFGLSGEQFSLV
jgi:hypothetical protein